MGCSCFSIRGPNPSKSSFSVCLFVLCLFFISLLPQSGPPLESRGTWGSAQHWCCWWFRPSCRHFMWKEVCTWRPVSWKWQGKLGLTSLSSGASRAFLCPLRWAHTLFTPSSHFISFTVSWSVRDSHMTNVECWDLFPFCITYEFDLHSRAVLISQSSSNHCVLLKNMHTIILPRAVLWLVFWKWLNDFWLHMESCVCDTHSQM